jgi:hypothetical protein
MRPSGCQMSKHFSAALTQQANRLSSQASAHVVVFAVDRQLPTGPDGSSKGALIDLGEPAESHDRLGNLRQRRKRRAGHTWRVVAARARLVGPLAVVVGEVRLGQFSNL